MIQESLTFGIVSALVFLAAFLFIKDKRREEMKRMDERLQEKEN